MENNLLFGLQVHGSVAICPWPEGKRGRQILEAASVCSNDAACELGVHARMVVLCCDHPALTVAQEGDLRETALHPHHAP